MCIRDRYIHCSSPGDGQTSRKVWLISIERRRCSDEVKTRNPLKFAGVPKLPNRSQPLVGRSAPYYKNTWRRYYCLTFFSDCRLNKCLSCEDIPDKVVRWCADGDFLRNFCVPYFKRAACSTFSDLHSKFSLRLHHVWKYGTHPISDR